jgi:hypothetical protein
MKNCKEPNPLKGVTVMLPPPPHAVDVVGLVVALNVLFRLTVTLIEPEQHYCHQLQQLYAVPEQS